MNFPKIQSNLNTYIDIERNTTLILIIFEFRGCFNIHYILKKLFTVFI